jgi:hypothetical protein
MKIKSKLAVQLVYPKSNEDCRDKLAITENMIETSTFVFVFVICTKKIGIPQYIYVRIWYV